MNRKARLASLVGQASCLSPFLKRSSPRDQPHLLGPNRTKTLGGRGMPRPIILPPHDSTAKSSMPSMRHLLIIPSLLFAIVLSARAMSDELSITPSQLDQQN